MFPTVYNKDETVTVSIFEGLDINLKDIFGMMGAALQPHGVPVEGYLPPPTPMISGIW